MKLLLSQQAKQKLAERAARSGQDMAQYTSELIEQAVTKPTLEELLGPHRAEIAASGMTDEELDAFHEQLRNKVWEERQGHKG